MKYLLRSASVLALAAAALAAHAQVELLTNGNFSGTSTTGTQSASTPSQLGFNGYGVTGWTSGRDAYGNLGYNLLFSPSLAGSAAYTSNGQYGNVQLYTSANAGSATAPSSLVSPTGGNFLALGGAFQQGALGQTLGSLAVGAQYGLSFYWAASQQAGASGTTTDSLGVSFGNQSFTTRAVTNPDRGFTPWTRVAFTFTATSTSQTLSFLAAGGPGPDQAPFALLDGVSLVQTSNPTPEPSALAALAFGAVAFVRRRRGG